MTSLQAKNLLRQLSQLTRPHNRDSLSDSDLVESFAAHSDETAFAALVERHGPMVWGVCRSVLHDWHDTEDAFQATFLVLARKAGSIQKRTSVASWLYGVAYHAALKARQADVRRRQREQRARSMSTSDPILDLSLRELLETLHEELQQLPEQFRAPLVLCYLEGKSQEEAAQQLGWSKSTTRGRLDRGREQLRQRLTRRGVSLAAAGCAIGVARPAAAAIRPVVEALKTGLLAGSTGTAPGLSANVVRLAEGVIHTMFATRFKPITTLLLATLVAAGSLFGLRGASPRAESPASARASAAAPQEPTGDPIVFAGRVLDPEGKPVSGAELFVLYYTPRTQPMAVRAKSSADGTFRFSIKRTEFDTSYSTEPWLQASVVARAAGYGLALPTFAPGKKVDRADLTLRLVKDDVPVRGRVLDLEGKPLAGVKITMHGLKAPTATDLGPFLAALKKGKEAYPEIQAHLRGFEGSWIGWDIGKLFPAVTTQRDGSFILRGVGRERVVSLRIAGPTIETQDFWILTRAGKENIRVPGYRDEAGTPMTFRSTGFDHAAAPTTVIVGVVRDKDTGKPIPGAVVSSYKRARDPISHRTDLRVTADSEGRFRLTGMPHGEGNIIMARAPDDQPYLMATRRVPKASGLEPVTVDFALKRGVLVTGKVTDKVTGQPVQAGVEYFVFADNPFRREVDGLVTDSYLRSHPTNGTFRLVALPGRGMIAVRGQGDRWLSGVNADRIKGLDKSGQFPTYPHYCFAEGYHTLVEINPDKGVRALDCSVELDPGRTLTGTVLGPDGKPLAGAKVKGLLSYGKSGYWQHTPQKSQFTVTGLAPGKKRRLVFLHEEKKLSGTTVVSGDDRQPITVKLAPWGEVTGRMVTADGLARAGLTFIFLNSSKSSDELATGTLPANPRPRTDKEGKFRIVGFVPGLKYTVGIIEGRRIIGWVFRDLEVKSGEIKDLGDIQGRE